MKKKTSLFIHIFVGGIIAYLIYYVIDKASERIAKKEKKIDQLRSYYDVLVQWMQLKEREISINEYFVHNNYTTIAIYGMGELGGILYHEIGGKIEVKYAIDRNVNFDTTEVKIKKLDDDLPDVDVIVVSVISAYESIKKELSGVVKCPIVSLEDIIYSL